MTLINSFYENELSPKNPISNNNILVKKIEHRGANRIGIFFEKIFLINAKLKGLGAKFSNTLKCWYLDYNQQSFQELKLLFPDLLIDKTNNLVSTPTQATGTNSRDILPIAIRSEIQLGSTMSNPEHTREEIPLATKVKLQKLENKINQYDNLFN